MTETMLAARVRAAMAYVLRREGLTYRQIGERLSVSQTRAQQLYGKALFYQEKGELAGNT